MDGYNNVIRGKQSFSYEVKAFDNRGITVIRDPQDEIFAQIEYTPETQEYVIEIDGGYTTLEDLKGLGLVNGMNLHRGEIPEFNDMIGSFETEEIDDWRDITYATLEKDGKTLELEHVESEERKTLVRLISENDNLSSQAEKLVNLMNPPFIEAEKGDPYGESWAPYSDSKVIRMESGNRENTIEEVFNIAINLTEDILEKKQKSRE